MAQSVRPTDGSRPSDPRDLIFHPNEADSLIPRPTPPTRSRFDIPTFFISVVLSALTMMLYRRISSLAIIAEHLPKIDAWVYYSILGAISAITFCVSYHLIHTSSS